MRAWLDRLNEATVGAFPAEDLAVVAGLIAFAALAGSLAGRWIAPSFGGWMTRRAGLRSDAVLKRMPALARFGTAAAILIFPNALLGLGLTAALLLAAALGLAMALFVHNLLRAAGVPFGIGLMLASALFVIILTGALGGLSPLGEGLDQAAITVGTRRISLLGVVTFLLVAALLFAVTRIVNRLVTHAIGRVPTSDLSQKTLFQKLGSITVVVIAILLGIDVLGIDLTTLTVFSGALGLAVGFGLQKTFGNLIAGLILLMDKSVKPGDVIAVVDTFGVINKIGVRAVSVITRDGKEHLIPNELLMTQPVENWSFSSRDVRIHIPVTISYDSDVPLAQKLMMQAVRESGRVLATPEPAVWLLNFGERGLEHDIRAWIVDPEQGVANVQSEILNRLWGLFREHGIGLPYPQRDVHLYTDPPERSGAANMRGLPPLMKSGHEP